MPREYQRSSLDLPFRRRRPACSPRAQHILANRLHPALQCRSQRTCVVLDQGVVPRTLRQHQIEQRVECAERNAAPVDRAERFGMADRAVAAHAFHLPRAAVRTQTDGDEHATDAGSGQKREPLRHLTPLLRRQLAVVVRCGEVERADTAGFLCGNGAARLRRCRLRLLIVVYRCWLVHDGASPASYEVCEGATSAMTTMRPCPAVGVALAVSRTFAAPYCTGPLASVATLPCH